MAVMARNWKGKNKNVPNTHGKKKFAKKGKKEFKSSGKRGRLILRNLPFKCTEEELHSHFSSFGEIKDINLLRRPNKKLVGCGFIEFTSRLDADKAKEQLNGKPFLGRPIYIERAVSQDSYVESKREEQEEPSEEESSSENESVKNEKKMKSSRENSVSGRPLHRDKFVSLNKYPGLKKGENKEECEEENSSDEEKIIKKGVKHETNSSSLPDFIPIEIKKEELDSDEDDENESKEQTLQSSKQDIKNLQSSKRSRLIIRNLSFKTNEQKLTEHFGKFGEVVDVKLLRKPDNSLVGCGFVEFSKKTAAAKAIHHTSGKPFLGRPIIVDWALPKDKFKNMQTTAVKKEIKEEFESDEEGKEEKPKNLHHDNSSEESGSSDEEDEESEAEEEDESDDEKESDGELESESGEEENNEQEVKEELEKPKRQRIEDVDEGKTVFVKNLPFSATDEDFRDCMEQFGPVFYALICKDKLTEHSKGSGFAKFKNKEDADKCLAAGTELTLKGNILDPHPALKRSEAQKLHEKNKEKKDNRNLYLVKEGLIIAGTPAAKGVSVGDMERRLQLEQSKNARLKDLNLFVSRERLVVHNLPETLSDKQLRKIFKKHSSSGAVIKEAKVIRDLKRADPSGKGASKGYGFVSFEKHEDALKALRSINNNPNIFTPLARPIVSFSVENRRVLNTKTKRLVRSRQKNPLCKDYKPEEAEEVPAKKAKRGEAAKSEAEGEAEYAGITAKPGNNTKMRRSYKLKNQAQQHQQDVRRQKRELKMNRQARRADHLKHKQAEKKLTKKKKNNTDKDVAFTSLVDKYKTKILSQAINKKKWYDD